MQTTRPDVALAVTVHDPGMRLAGQAAAQLPILAARYRAVVAYCSRETNAGLLAVLGDNGAAVYRDAEPSAGIDRIGAVRRETIRAGLSAGTGHLHLCDFDRALHWSARYPAEMDAVAAEVCHPDLLVMGRTRRAWATHPPYQAETEPLFNTVFALVSGREWDVGAGSRGLSRRAAEALLDLSTENSVGVDAEWPLLLLGREGWLVDHRKCEGLEFETADAFGPEIEAAGGVERWVEEMSADPRRWVFRLRVALLIAESAIRAGAVGRAV